MESEGKKRVIEFVMKWCRTRGEAEVWYSNEQISAMNCTPEEAVDNGKVDLLIDHLKSIDVGGFA